MAIGQGNNFFDTLASPDGSGQQFGNGHLLGRVAHIVYGPYFSGTDIPDPSYKDPTDLGKILFEIINGTQSATGNSQGNQPAKPFYSWMKQYPVEGEYVHIIQGPGLALNDNTGQKEYYYLPPFNLWGAPNHNALPNLADYGEYVGATKVTYAQNQVTNQASNLTTSSVEYPLGNGFYEKGDVKALEMFIGDVAFEGRYGASIRFGSSLGKNKNQNDWWNGPNGNPITIIRNGQGKQIDQEGWIPTVEDINRDPSSIYLTNGQVIEIADIMRNFPLETLGVTLRTKVVANAIPLNQQLTSIESLSAKTQDIRINNENPSVIK